MERVFTTAVEHVDGRTIVYLRGDLDIATAGHARAALALAIGAGRDVIVDLRDLSFVSAAAVSVLLGGYRRATESNVGFTVTNPMGIVAKVFEALRLDSVFTVRYEP